MGRQLQSGHETERWRMLLRMHAAEDVGGMRENVRVAEVRVAVVGGYLRETKGEDADGESRSRAAVSAPA